MMVTDWQHRFLFREVHIAPLAAFRFIFGSILFISVIRFMLMGWVEELYVQPQFFFTYYGFDWVKPLGFNGMYALFGLMAVAFLMLALGWYYRIASVVAFLSFTYVELIDKTNYLNHYYFVSIICFLLIFLPAHRYFSIDARRKSQLASTHVSAWTINLLKVQLAIVYFYAGMAKLNSDWMLHALPLKMWLPAHAHLAFVGDLLSQEWVAYAFSWGGAFYDLFIPFFLFWRASRGIAYFFVIAFHILTYLLFPIGMFPFIMIGATLIFFSSAFHLSWMRRLEQLLPTPRVVFSSGFSTFKTPVWLTKGLLALFILCQLLLPFRYLLYPGHLFWTEEGYRFSWRVMLMEKAGDVTFKVHDPLTTRRWEVRNYAFLTPNQEKMMATQPDMILQFAHFLEQHYRQKGFENVEIRAEAYVSLNGEPSRLFLDSSVNLSLQKESFAHKDWILPFEDGNHKLSSN